MVAYVFGLTKFAVYVGWRIDVDKCHRETDHGLVNC